VNDSFIFMTHFNFTKLLKRRYMCHASIATGIILTYVRITPCYDVSNDDICYRNRIRAGVRIWCAICVHQCNVIHKSACNKGN